MTMIRFLCRHPATGVPSSDVLEPRRRDGGAARDPEAVVGDPLCRRRRLRLQVELRHAQPAEQERVDGRVLLTKITQGRLPLISDHHYP